MIRKHIDASIPAENVQVNQFVGYFPTGWEESIAADLAKVKTWKSGVYR